MKKKIVFFMFSLGGGGAERTIVNIINNIDKNFFEVTLIIGTPRKKDYLYLISDQVKIRHLNCERLRFSFLKLRRAIIKEKPDLLFSTLVDNNIMLLFTKLFAFKGIPTIVREASHRSQSGKVTFLNRLVTKTFYNILAKKVIALSYGVKQDLVENFLIKEEKVKVIYNPIEVKNIRDMSMEPVYDYLKQNNTKVLITVGRFDEAKDHITLLRALKLILKKKDVKLIMLGEGPLKSQIIGKAKELKVIDYIEFLGFKENPYKYMKLADVFILSSKWEGFSHVITEAMAVGVPVISTNCKSGPPEIIQCNKYGLLVPTQNPEALSCNVINLLDDNNIQKKYIEEGMKRAKDFEAQKITREYEEVFNNVCKK